MSTIATAPEITRLQISLKWLWVGPVAGIACMIALFIAGVATQTPSLMIIPASMVGALGGMWAGLRTSLRRKLAQAQQR